MVAEAEAGVGPGFAPRRVLLERLGVRLLPGDYLAVVAQGGAGRLAPLAALWGQVLAGVRQLVLVGRGRRERRRNREVGGVCRAL